MKLGMLRGLYRYPVKSLRADALTEAPVDADGVEGDRTQALIVGAGRPRAGKRYNGKRDDRLHLLSSAGEALALAPEEGLTVEASPEHFFDDAPVSLLVDRWLDGVSKYVGYRVEHQRFRPNFYIESDGDIPDEGALTGRELALGEVTLRVRYPIERCVVTTYDPAGGQSDSRILRYIAQARANWMGIYCDVPRAGIVRIGDSLSLIER
jgi:uncharacterized protein YcbX